MTMIIIISVIVSTSMRMSVVTMAMSTAAVTSMWLINTFNTVHKSGLFITWNCTVIKYNKV